MTSGVDLYEVTYSHFTRRVLGAIREETFGRDIGQNSWLTVDEFDRFASWLNLSPEDNVLEVASGSGGPALYLANERGCHVTGIDVDARGIATAKDHAVNAHQTQQVSFQIADATAPMPFEEDCFDALVCIDSMNHFPNRLDVLREWRRVLRPGRRAVFTDPVVITGPVTNDELTLRSSIGRFLFVPPGINERLIDEAGLRLIHQQDVTESAALVSGRWHHARGRHQEALLRIEGERQFEDLQRFFAAVHRLSADGRLSRIVYLVEKPAGARPDR